MPVNPQARDRVPNIKTPPENVNVAVDGDRLTVWCDLTVLLGPTRKGRADLVANSHSWIPVPGFPGHWVSFLVVKRSAAREEKARLRALRRTKRAAAKAARGMT